jgi:chaperonin cofactor prefoldin
MIETKNMAELITRYEELRLQLRELDAQTERLDMEIAEMERELPDDYVYPGDEAVAPKRPR